MSKNIENKLIAENSSMQPANEVQVAQLSFSKGEITALEWLGEKDHTKELTFKNGAPRPNDGQEKVLPIVILQASLFSSSYTAALQTVHNAAAGRHWLTKDKDAALTAAMAQMVDLAPETHLEAMLVSQMVAVNAAIGKLMNQGMHPDQTAMGADMLLRQATKMQKVFLQQIEALQKLRGKGQQKVTVEHFHVHQGGQAIVGNVEHRTEGGG